MRAFCFAPKTGSGGDSQCLHLGRQAALVARCLVLVEQAFVGDRVDHGLGVLEDFCGLRLVTGNHGLFHKNKAARHKSRLSAKVKALAAAA